MRVGHPESRTRLDTVRGWSRVGAEADPFQPTPHHNSGMPSCSGERTHHHHYHNHSQTNKNTDGSFMREENIRKKGYTNPRIISNHKLSPDSRPDEFSEVFIPFSMNKPDGKKEMVSFELLTKLTNLKATITNAGPGGVCYHDFHPFSVRKTRQYI